MPPTPRLGRAPPAFASPRVVRCGPLVLLTLQCAKHSAPIRDASSRPRSADARDAGLAAQAVEGGQNRRQIIPLIEAEIAKREDKRADDGGRDLDDKSHRRVRRRAVARTCTGWGRAAFLAPAKRARLGIAVSQVGDRQRAARNGALGPPTAGAVEGGAACSPAKDLRRAAPPRHEWLSTPQASQRGRGHHGALNFGSAAAISSPARAMARQGASVTAPIALDWL